MTDSTKAGSHMTAPLVWRSVTLAGRPVVVAGRLVNDVAGLTGLSAGYGWRVVSTR